MERRRIVFTGRVQGVGFRTTTKAIARRHPVTGWVRNCDDGTVEMHVQGDPVAIDETLVDLRTRMAAFIASEQTMPVATERGEEGFEIRR